MWKYKKFISLVVIVLMVVVFLSGCISSNNTKQFNSNDISFDYPDSWVNSTSNNADNEIFNAKKTLFLHNGMCTITVQPANSSTNVSNDMKIFELHELNFVNAKRISYEVITVAGVEAYKLILDENDPKTGHDQIETISFVKNDKYVILTFGCNNINDIQKDIDIILKTFQVK